MKINIKGTNIQLTSAITDYVMKKMSTIEKFVDDANGEAIAQVEVGKTTRHHKSGDIFRAEVNLSSKGKVFYAFSEQEDLYAAIDLVKDEVLREVRSYKTKVKDVFRKSALKIKNIIKRGE